MNKINILINEDDKTHILDGYYNLTMDSIDKIINGTCEEIICATLDTNEYQERISNTVKLCKKLANNGYLTIKFLDGTKLCKDVYRGNSSGQYLSNIVSKSKSLFLDSDLMEMVSQMQDIKLHKMYNDNNYIVAVLQKKL